MTSTLTCSVESPASDALERLDRALHVGLEDDLELLDRALLDAARAGSRARPWCLRASSFLRRESRRCSTSSLARFSSPTALKSSPAFGHARRGRAPRPASTGATSVERARPCRRASRAPCRCARRRRRCRRACSVPSCTSTVATGPRLAVELGLDRPCRVAGLFGLALSSSSSACSAIISQQLVDALLGARRDVDVDGLAAPLLGDEAVLGELLLDALRVARPACRSC